MRCLLPLYEILLPEAIMSVARSRLIQRFGRDWMIYALFHCWVEYLISQNSGFWDSLYLERAADDRLHSTDFSQPVQGMIYDDPGQFFIVRISSQGELLYSRNGGWEAALAISEEGLTEFASVEVGDEEVEGGKSLTKRVAALLCR